MSGGYAIAGAHGENTGGSNAGAAYIFNKDQNGADNWGQVTKLTASDTQVDEWFGISISISGDYAIVGIDEEAAYIFNKDHGGADYWGEVGKLTASDAACDDAFGYSSVSISGDSFLVGACWEAAGGFGAGAAYL